MVINLEQKKIKPKLVNCFDLKFILNYNIDMIVHVYMHRCMFIYRELTVMVT